MVRAEAIAAFSTTPRNSSARPDSMLTPKLLTFASERVSVAIKCASKVSSRLETISLVGGGVEGHQRGRYSQRDRISEAKGVEERFGTSLLVRGEAWAVTVISLTLRQHCTDDGATFCYAF